MKILSECINTNDSLIKKVVVLKQVFGNFVGEISKQSISTTFISKLTTTHVVMLSLNHGIVCMAAKLNLYFTLQRN
jgi:hypothetical protein